jgi:hypothetical protein
MTTIVKTEFVVTSQDKAYSIPGDRTADFIKSSYSAAVPGLSNMDATEEIQDRADGAVKVITFKNRVGTKG